MFQLSWDYCEWTAQTKRQKVRRCYSNLELAVLFEMHCMTCCTDAFRIFLIFSYVRTSALSSGAPTGRATNKNNLKQKKSLESPIFYYNYLFLYFLLFFLNMFFKYFFLMCFLFFYFLNSCLIFLIILYVFLVVFIFSYFSYFFFFSYFFLFSHLRRSSPNSHLPNSDPILIIDIFKCFWRVAARSLTSFQRAALIQSRWPWCCRPLLDLKDSRSPWRFIIFLVHAHVLTIDSTDASAVSASSIQWVQRWSKIYKEKDII